MGSQPLFAYNFAPNDVIGVGVVIRYTEDFLVENPGFPLNRFIHSF